MSQYKYYFKKPKSEITKDIFKWLAIAGLVYIASGSPYFVVNVIRGAERFRKYERKKVYDTFYKLQKRGYLSIGSVGKQIYISLTPEGKKAAGRFQIDALAIAKPKKWDRKWRLVIFDIAQMKKAYREAFRGKLKQLGFYPLQKSIWVHPFHCKDEIDLLRDFFGLTEKELRLVVASDIGNDTYLKRIFKI